MTECMVRFRDGTSRLCRVRRWQRTGPGRDDWRLLLVWTVTGLTFGDWFAYDPAHIEGDPDKPANS